MDPLKLSVLRLAELGVPPKTSPAISNDCAP